MPNPTIRLVVSDMDGSLLNSAHEVSGEFFALHDQLRARGIRFAAASGRQFASIVDKLAPIADGLLVLAENGAYVRDGEEELLTTAMSREAVVAVLEAIAPHPAIHPVVCTPSAAYVHEGRGDFHRFMAEFYATHEPLSNLPNYPGQAVKVALYHADGSEEHIFPVVQGLSVNLKVKVSGPLWVDVSHPDAHKGTGLALAQRRLSVTPAETMAFGDYLNDLELLGLAQYSYAMANAHPEVLAKARYRTGSNDEGGVEQVLRKLLGGGLDAG